MYCDLGSKAKLRSKIYGDCDPWGINVGHLRLDWELGQCRNLLPKASRCCCLSWRNVDIYFGGRFANLHGELGRRVCKPQPAVCNSHGWWFDVGNLQQCRAVC